MQDYITSVIRTAVPYVVGAVISYLTTKGFHVSPAQVAQATSGLTLLLGTLYYLAVRALERKWPKLGYLLGVPVEPIY